ncbi:hypothetical protein BU15DRAFT_52200, partial [Melanogaster broomeanus]
HPSVTFPAWHRPYVMLVEVHLCQSYVAQQIESFHCEEVDLWVPAAKKFRFPLS